MRLEKEIEVPSAPETVWAFLSDIERLAHCLPGCRDVRALVPHERYEAVISERVGPFSVRIPLDIQVTEADEPCRRLKAEAAGRDEVMGTSLRVTLDLRVEVAGAGSRVIIVSDASLSGRLTALGDGFIRQRADGIVTKFAQAVQRELEGAG